MNSSRPIDIRHPCTSIYNDFAASFNLPYLRRKALAIGIVSLYLLLLLGCGVKSRNAEKQQMNGRWHTVKEGDTLESLALRYRFSADDVRELNGLGKDGKLRIGQEVFLYEARKIKRTLPRLKPSESQQSGSSGRPTSKTDRAWIYPVRGGRLTSPFGQRGNRPHKGIDLAAKMGTPIYATADGVVVYSGSRQRGYGNLVILKHADDYVSVYAHNRRNLVDEGQKVRQGFQIAELGNSGRSTGPHLHFEIRHKGKPLDPLRLIGKTP